MRILIAGELNVDLVLHNYDAFPQLGREVLVEDVSLTLGSASAICASGFAKLGNDIAFIGKVGCDSWGDLCVKSLGDLGVDLSHVLRDPNIKTGITVSITSAKDRALVTYLGSISALEASDIEDGWFEGYRHLHVSSFFLQQKLRPGLRSLLVRARRAGLTTSIDPGFDPSEAWGRDLVDALDETDIFLPNEVELAAIARSADRIQGLRALENGRTATVVKLGAEGCIALDGAQPLRVPAFVVDPIDTTGAGDSFNAGFLHAWLRGQTMLESMTFGAACGALSTRGIGGTAAQPNEAEVEAFLAAESVRSTEAS